MSYIAKGLHAVGKIFAHAAASDDRDVLEALPERSDAGSRSTHHHARKLGATRQHPSQVPSSPTVPARSPVPIPSASPEQRPRRYREKESREDEKRLTGDFTTPADAVIFLPPTVHMVKPKSIYGGHRPVNTLSTQKISNLEARPRVQKTYGSSRNKRISSFHADDDPILDDEPNSPRKKRRISIMPIDPTPIHVLEDDPSPVTACEPRRSVEKPIPRHTRHELWDPLAKSEFIETCDIIEGHTYSPQSSGRRTSSASVRQEGKLVRPTAKQRKSETLIPIEVSDDDESKRHHSPPKLRKHITDAVNTAIGGIPGSPARVRHEGKHENKSKYFAPSTQEKATGSQAHDTHSDYVPLIWRDKKFSNTQREPTPRLQNQFRRDEGLHSDESSDELTMDPREDTAHRPSVLNKPLTKGVASASSRGEQQPSIAKKPQYRLRYLASHDISLNGPPLSLIYDPEAECYYARVPESKSSTLQAVARIDPKKINRTLECAESLSVRITGHTSGTQQYWYDLRFENHNEFAQFVGSLPELGVKRYRKSSTEMRKLFRKPVGCSSEQNQPEDQELNLLQANAQRREGQRLEQQFESPESRLPRKRNLVQKMLEADAKNNPTKKPRTDTTDNEFCQEKVDLKQPAGSLRRTRASLNPNTAKVFRVSSPSPPPSTDLELVDVEKYSVVHGLGPKWEKPVEYPPVGRRKATVHQEDLERLDEGQFLNDTIIEFYMLWAYNQAKLPQGQIHLFNTYFYETLSKKQTGINGVNYHKVARWVKDDLFSYDYVVVPVNEDTHWYVAIICNLPNIEGIKTTSTLADNPVKTEAVDLEVEDKRDPSKHESQVSETPSNSMGANHVSYTSITDKGAGFSSPSRQAEHRGLIGDDATDTKALDPETAEWPDAEENRKSNSSTPFQETSARVQALSLKDEPSGSNLESPSSKPSAGSAKGKKRGPPLKKYDPDQPIIIFLDSLELTHSKTSKFLKEYIHEEGKAKRHIDIHITSQSMNAKGIPRQSNFCDCGVFVLRYLQAFFKNPREFVTKILTREMDVETDWIDANPSQLRTEIRDLLFDLHMEQDAEYKREKALKKKMKKRSPNKLVLKEEEPKKEPENHGGARTSPSPAKQTKSPEDVNRKIKHAKLNDAPSTTTKEGGSILKANAASSPAKQTETPEEINIWKDENAELEYETLRSVENVEEPSSTPSSPTLPSRIGVPEANPNQSTEGYVTRIPSEIPETPTPRHSRLGSETDPIEIEDSQPAFSQGTDRQQSNGGELSSDWIAELQYHSKQVEAPFEEVPSQEPQRLSRILKSRKPRRVIDVDKFEAEAPPQESPSEVPRFLRETTKSRRQPRVIDVDEDPFASVEADAAEFRPAAATRTQIRRIFANGGSPSTHGQFQ